MRKILLASSALVAAVGVSVASAEVTVGAYYEFGYSSVSDNSTTDDRSAMFSDSEVHFSFSKVSDSGLTYSARVELEAAADTGTGNNVDESSMSLSTAEIGTLTLGQNDDVTGTFSTALPYVRNIATGDDTVATPSKGTGGDIEAGLLYAYTSAGVDYSDGNKISYVSPSLNGLKVGGSYAADSTTGSSADTSFGGSYSTDVGGASISIQAHSNSNGESGTDSAKRTGYGFNASMGDLSFGASKASNKNSDGDVTSNGLGLGYSLSSDVSVVAGFVKSENGTSKNKLTATSYGMSYTIAPGLNFAVALNQYKYDDQTAAEDQSSSEVRASIQANF